MGNAVDKVDIMPLPIGASSALIQVDPAAHFHPTGLEITPGTHYRFVASGQWRDGFLPPVGPEGWRLPWAEYFNRLPGQPFFLLCGCVGRDLAQAFAIGAGLADWQAPAALAEQADRQLYLFANDWAGMYWNNHALGPEQGGPLSVQIIRLS